MGAKQGTLIIDVMFIIGVVTSIGHGEYESNLNNYLPSSNLLFCGYEVIVV